VGLRHTRRCPDPDHRADRRQWHVVLNRQQLVWPVAGWFALGAVPLAIAGGLAFAVAPAPVLQRVLGVFLLASVAYRHTDIGRRWRIELRGFAVLGAVAGLGSAIVGTVGPLVAPFFLSYGLVSGAYIGTEALTALTMHGVKLVVYGGASLVNARAVEIGLGVGVAVVGGSYVGKRFLDRMPARIFPLLVEIVLVVSGLQLLLA